MLLRNRLSSLTNVGERSLVDQMCASWNRVTSWLRPLDQLRLGFDRSRARETIGQIWPRLT
jgi:hypothetical protein